MAIGHPLAPVCRASLAPDQAEVTSGLCDRGADAVLAVAVWVVADRDLETVEIRIPLQDDVGLISRHTLNYSMWKFGGRHNTAIPVGNSGVTATLRNVRVLECGPSDEEGNATDNIFSNMAREICREYELPLDPYLKG